MTGDTLRIGYAGQGAYRVTVEPQVLLDALALLDNLRSETGELATDPPHGRITDDPHYRAFADLALTVQGEIYACETPQPLPEPPPEIADYRPTLAGYTYSRYLDEWRRLYGDTAHAYAHYTSRGVDKVWPLGRLTREEFEHERQDLVLADYAFEIANRQNDTEGMNLALSRAFPHEMALCL